jgi:hypothetical protein
MTRLSEFSVSILLCSIVRKVDNGIIKLGSTSVKQTLVVRDFSNNVQNSSYNFVTVDTTPATWHTHSSISIVQNS